MAKNNSTRSNKLSNTENTDYDEKYNEEIPEYFNNKKKKKMVRF